MPLVNYPQLVPNDEMSLLSGKQRYFGTIGFLLASLGMALINKYTSDGSGQTNLTGNFISYIILTLLTAAAGYFLKIKGDLKCGGLLHDVGKVMRNPEAVAMLLFVMGMGINLGCHDAFLFLHVKELGGSDIYLGLSLFMGCLIEIPSVFFADKYMGRLGYVNCLYISCIAYTLRLLGYGFMQAPWLVLLINLLHSVTFGFMFCSATAYGSLLTPPAMHATMQGLVQSMHFAIGKYFICTISYYLGIQYIMHVTPYHTMNRVCEICRTRRGLISPDILSSARKSRTLFGKWMSSKKLVIRWTFYSGMSDENPKCPARLNRILRPLTMKMNILAPQIKPSLDISIFTLKCTF